MSTKNNYISIGPPPNGDENSRPEINLRDSETDGKPDDQRINCGYVPVVLSKLFGPLIFADIRIRANHETCEWIIERENTVRSEAGDELRWVEVARIPGQIESDFSE